jgi:RNA polymerase sigma-70 factor (ECF subfamily)
MDDAEITFGPGTTALARTVAGVADRPDPVLVIDILNGSHAALAEVYGRHGSAAHDLAARLYEAEADRIVQAVFLQLWRRPERFDPSRGSLRSFLTSEVHRRAIGMLRSSGSHRALATARSAEHAGPGAEDGSLAHLVGERAWSLLCRLDETHRNAITLAYFGGHTCREVAELLTVPESTVRDYLRQGLTQLRPYVEAENADSHQP